MSNLVRCCAVLCGALICLSASAQTPSPTPRQTNNPNTRAGGKPPQARPTATPKDANNASSAEEADSLAGVRRGMALSLITSLADEAQGFRDAGLRARVQARAADALWETDAERARTLLRRAWDAAESADAESVREFNEGLSQARGRGESFAARSPSNLRGEVLGFAVRRDRALGEEFLVKLDDGRKREAEANNQSSNNAAGNAATNSNAPNNATRDNFSDRYMSPAPAVRQRLEVARELLDEGDAQRALDFAAPALVDVSVPAIDFLTRLRDKNPQLADTRYRMMLTRALNDPSADANAVSVLFSYLFTPHFYLLIQGSGSASTMRQDQPRPAPEVAPALRDAFFRTASSILLRTLSPEERERLTTAGRRGAHAIISRLLPIFEKYGSDQIPALRSQLSALAPEQTATADQSSRPNVVGDISTVGLVPQENADRDRVQMLLERAERAAKPEERDMLYLQAATAAERESESRAREIAAKIQDTETRKQLLAYIAFNALRRAIESKMFAEVERAARAEELTNEQRAWGLTEAARFALKTARPRAVELLDEALAEARRVDAGTPQRARLLAAVATVMLEVDRARIWEIVPEIVKAANAADDYTGEGGMLMNMLRAKQMTFVNSQNVEGFNLTELFGALSREDFIRALELAKTLTGEAARANAQIAIARRTLAKNK